MLALRPMGLFILGSTHCSLQVKLQKSSFPFFSQQTTPRKYKGHTQLRREFQSAPKNFKFISSISPSVVLAGISHPDYPTIDTPRHSSPTWP